MAAEADNRSQGRANDDAPDQPPPEPDNHEPATEGASRLVELSFELPQNTQVRISLERYDLASDPQAEPQLESFLIGPTGIIEPGPGDETDLAGSSGATAIQITETFETGRNDPGTSPPLAARGQAKLGAISWSLESVLFGLALALYLAVRLVGLRDFPIYFFTDEAIQTVLAADLVRDEFRGAEKEVLPTYFKNYNYYNLSASVYLQVLPYLLFGKSVLVTRTVAVLVTLLAAVSVALVLRDIFKIPYWWSATLLLSVSPAWFLHSRTAFETALFVSFYAATLYAYLLYRYRSPRYLYIALIMAGLAFYSYSPGQAIIGVTAFLWLVLDAKYHWENRGTLLKGAGLVILLAVPYLRFRFSHQTAALDHLRLLGSYWLKPIPLNEKIQQFVSVYTFGLSPAYWFAPHDHDLPRHLMKDYGHLLRWTFPFFLLGVLIGIRNIRSSAHRVILTAALAVPVGAALVGIGITRVLAFVIPATLLTTLGLAKVSVWLESPASFFQNLRFKRIPGWLERIKLPRTALSIGLFIILALANIIMLRDALVNGPTWFDNYGMGGMQYGANQIFGEIKDFLAEQPDAKIILSPTWANGADVVARFFLPDPMPIQIGSVDGHLNQHLPLDDNSLFITTPDEYRKIFESEKFANVRVEKTIPYPNGEPGFYFVRLRYVDNIDDILAAEQVQRQQLQEELLEIDNQPVKVHYSYIDMGEIGLVFDGDPYTLTRTYEANPFVIELSFPDARRLSGISVIIGSIEAQVKALVYTSTDQAPEEFSITQKGSVEQPEVRLDFFKPIEANVLRVEVSDVHQDEPAHVHIWEIELISE